VKSSDHPSRPGPLVGGPNPAEQRSGRARRPLLDGLFALLAPLIVAFMRLLWMSYRFRIVGEEPVRRLVERSEPMILTCWHESIFVMAWYTLHLTRLGAHVTYLVSPSRDGDLVVRVLRVIGARVVRGSATRSGVKALHGLYRAITGEGGSPLMLCDGPQGPRRHCKPGSILLGQLSGARVRPIGSWPRRAVRLRTWDRAFIPLPFSRVAIVLGAPFTVAAGLSADDQEHEREALEAELARLVERARGIVNNAEEMPPVP
jgi:lysophospholipid acyltransferase (LPLAT)-like uncharacterized protein